MLPEVSSLRAKTLLCCFLAAVLPSRGDVLSGLQLVTDLSNNFVPKLFQALAPGRENLVFAPFGLATNVAMLLEAARGDTAKEILKALNISSNSLPDLRIGFKAYCDTFEAAAENKEAAGSFNMATMVSSQPLLASYKAILNKFYRVNLTEISRFDNLTGARPASVSLELRSDSGVMSHWKDYDRLAAFSFLSHEPAAPFQRTPTDTIPVPMVPQVGDFRAGRIHQLNAHGVELPLEVGSVSLLLLVPDSSDNLDELLVKLPGVSLQQLVQEWLPHSEASVSLPQFTIVSSAIDVTQFLRQLGVRAVFNATSADLSAATPAPYVHVKSVIQDAFFSTSFVSVNSVGSVSTNLVPKRPKRESTNLVVDRPFLFFLLHRDTQLVLLAGKVQNPTQVP
ncbi:leukocyte elastase inhibitor A-like [Zootermopsis nevadensis]|uniref:Serpin B8 n=1 Tax=Zootermopsis nevadensis TaxID=136037 RepID=A0A067RDA0_ZOONE|nr:leukocyte elastase inhibitor A-like [Zootermopsis nevadensis]XP_021924896.1 leukocyte elastase inhibitor A-like [Zootermopsis nevadensis]KDR16748.1 Serpin B8 [Zootermopsis nevadensis]